MTTARVCACGRDAVEVVRVASDDGLLLVPVCAECADDPVSGEQRELFGGSERRPLTAMPGRGDDRRQPLALEDVDDDQGAA